MFEASASFRYGLVSLFALLFSSQAAAWDCDRLNFYWKRKFHSDFGATWKNRPFRCHYESRDFLLALAAYRLYSRKNANRYEFVTSRIGRTVLGGPGDKHVAESNGLGTVTLYDSFFDARSSIAREEILVHEARHSDWGTKHVLCESGENRGEQACDQKFYGDRFTGGAYQYGFAYLAHLRDDPTLDSGDQYEIFKLLSFRAAHSFNDISPSDLQKWTRMTLLPLRRETTPSHRFPFQGKWRVVSSETPPSRNGPYVELALNGSSDDPRAKLSLRLCNTAQTLSPGQTEVCTGPGGARRDSSYTDRHAFGAASDKIIELADQLLYALSPNVQGEARALRHLRTLMADSRASGPVTLRLDTDAEVEETARYLDRFVRNNLRRSIRSNVVR